MTIQLSPNGDLEALIEDRQGIMLDLGCGANKQPGFVGMDMLDLPGVDIVHDLNVHPWPLPDECATRMIAGHLLEHIPPSALGYRLENGELIEYTRRPFIEFMNEAWRVMKPGAEFLIAVPFWSSPGFAQDPTHVNPCSEATWAYFDPLNHTNFWRFYQPKPWYLRFVSFDPIANMEVILMRHSEDPELWREEREKWGPMMLGE